MMGKEGFSQSKSWEDAWTFKGRRKSEGLRGMRRKKLYILLQQVILLGNSLQDFDNEKTEDVGLWEKPSKIIRIETRGVKVSGGAAAGELWGHLRIFQGMTLVEIERETEREK